MRVSFIFDLIYFEYLYHMSYLELFIIKYYPNSLLYEQCCIIDQLFSFLQCSLLELY